MNTRQSLDRNVLVGFVSDKPSQLRVIFSVLADTMVKGRIVIDSDGMKICGIGNGLSTFQKIHIKPQDFSEFRYQRTGPFSIPVCFFPIKQHGIAQKAARFAMFVTPSSLSTNDVVLASVNADGSSQILEVKMIDLADEDQDIDANGQQLCPRVKWDEAFRLKKQVLDEVVRSSTKSGPDIYISYKPPQQPSSNRGDDAGNLFFTFYSSEYGAKGTKMFPCYYPRYITADTSSSSSSQPSSSSRQQQVTTTQQQQRGDDEDIRQSDAVEVVNAMRSITSANGNGHHHNQQQQMMENKKCCVLDPNAVDLPFSIPIDQLMAGAKYDDEDSTENPYGVYKYGMTSLASIARFCAVSDDVILCRKTRGDPDGPKPIGLRFFLGESVVDCMLCGKLDESSANVFSSIAAMMRNTTTTNSDNHHGDILDQVQLFVNASNEIIQTERDRSMIEMKKQSQVDQVLQEFESRKKKNTRQRNDDEEEDDDDDDGENEIVSSPSNSNNEEEENDSSSKKKTTTKKRVATSDQQQQSKKQRQTKKPKSSSGDTQQQPKKPRKPRMTKQQKLLLLQQQQQQQEEPEEEEEQQTEELSQLKKLLHSLDNNQQEGEISVN